MQVDYIKIYRAYIQAKNDKKKTIIQVANELGIARSSLYEIVRHIENGDITQIRKCTKQSRLNCLWEHKYKIFYEALPKNKKVQTVEVFKKLIRDMHKDGFGVSLIAELTGKDRSTVLYHLK